MLFLDVSLCAHMIINDIENLPPGADFHPDELLHTAECEEEEAVLWFRFGRT